MAVFTSAHHSPTHYLFIDGGYLRSALERKAKKFFGLDTIPLDYQSFFGGIGYSKRFYYDCLPPKKSGEAREDHELRIQPVVDHFNNLRGLDGFHVFLGSTTSEGTKARQKGVDIMISVHMLTHSFRGNMAKATLLTGDSDFKPLIEALVQDGTDVTLWYDPENANQDLVYAADSQRTLEINFILLNAPAAFRIQHPPAQLFSGPFQGKTLNGEATARPVRLGTTSSGFPVMLFQLASGPFLLILPDKFNMQAGYSLHIQHSDAGFIEKFMAERQTPITWDLSYKG